MGCYKAAVLRAIIKYFDKNHLTILLLYHEHFEIQQAKYITTHFSVINTRLMRGNNPSDQLLDFALGLFWLLRCRLMFSRISFMTFESLILIPGKRFHLSDKSTS